MADTTNDTTIRISKVTRDRLAKLCAKNQSYDQIIMIILDDYSE